MLSAEDVRHIAHLARLGLDDAEVEMYRKDLSSILEYFTELDAVDTADVAPIGHITGMTNVYREDVAASVSDEERSLIMEQVPQTRSGFVKVKSVF